MLSSHPVLVVVPDLKNAAQGYHYSVSDGHDRMWTSYKGSSLGGKAQE